MESCPRCFGRGYKPEDRKPSKRNPLALGFYARTCPRCQGSGSVEAKPAKKDVDTV
jgi:DnaJ-class molecular chaperone